MDRRVIEWLVDAGIHSVIQEKHKNDIQATDVCNLDDLKQVVEHLNVPIKACAINMVFGCGNKNADILLLGEAPGAEVDKQGLPFVGQSGKLLDKILGAVGLNRDIVYITNILPWRPPGNRTPTSEEIALFRPYVIQHINLIAPKVVICLGGTSAKALLQTSDGIMKIRGKWHNIPELSAKIYATFHPAYLLRSPSQKREVWYDFLKIMNDIS